MAQEACGLGVPFTSTRHMRQLPAMDRRSWKQKRGTSAPACSQACSSVVPFSISISVPSIISFGILHRLSSAALGVPALLVYYFSPTKGMIGRAIFLIVLKPVHRLLQGWPVALFNPPEHHVRLFHQIK